MKSQTITLIIYALCLLAPWSLLWLDASLLFPYTTGKAWVFRSMVELAFALSLILRIATVQQGGMPGPTPARIQILPYALLLFLCWTTLSNILGVDVYRSFWSNWERMGGLIDYVHWAMYLFCLLTILNTARSRVLLFNLSIIISLVCLIAFFSTEKRSISTLGNPIYLGNLAVFGIFINAYLIAGRSVFQGWKKIFLNAALLLGIALMLGALVLSASRGPVLALLVGGLVLALSLGFSYAKQRSTLSVAILSVFLLFSGSALVSQYSTLQAYMKQSDSYALQRLGRISLRNRTTVDRLENWQIALDAAQSRPVTGWGQENYMIAFNQHYRPGVIDKSALWFDRSHNAYLDIFVDSGIPGLMLYLLILGLPVWFVWRVVSLSFLEKSIISGLLVAMMVKNIVGFDTFSSTLVWISVISIILTALSHPLKDRRAPAGAVHVKPGVPLVVLLLAAAMAIYALNIKPYQENRRYAKLMGNTKALRTTELEYILQQAESSLRYAHTSKLEVFDSILNNTSSRKLTTYEAERKTQVYQKSTQLITLALNKQPNDFRIKYNGAILLARFGQLSKATLMMEELTKVVPNRTAFWYTLSKLYSAQGMNDSATNALATARGLNPDVKLN